MRIRMLTTVVDQADHATSARQTVYEAGQEYDLEAKLAKDFVSTPKDMPRAEVVAQRAVEKAERRG